MYFFVVIIQAAVADTVAAATEVAAAAVEVAVIAVVVAAAVVAMGVDEAVADMVAAVTRQRHPGSMYRCATTSFLVLSF